MGVTSTRTTSMPVLDTFSRSSTSVMLLVPRRLGAFVNSPREYAREASTYEIMRRSDFSTDPEASEQAQRLLSEHAPLVMDAMGDEDLYLRIGTAPLAYEPFDDPERLHPGQDDYLVGRSLAERVAALSGVDFHGFPQETFALNGIQPLLYQKMRNERLTPEEEELVAEGFLTKAEILKGRSGMSPNEDLRIYLVRDLITMRPLPRKEVAELRKKQGPPITSL